MPSNLGILDVQGDVPGSVHLRDQEQRLQELEQNHSLHRAKNGTILVPQPNVADPNDPLTWPLWKRDFMLVILLFAAVLATTTSALLAADTITVALYFRRSFLAGARLTAFHLAGAAVSAWISVPFARVFGKRSTFLIASIFIIVGSAWGGSTHDSKNFASFTWARVVQGLGVAPFESIVNTVVGDLYYVHERGPRMALVNTTIFAGAFLTPVFVGMIVDDVRLGWKWTFYFVAIFEAVGFVLMFFFFPETVYLRPAHLETDMTAFRSSHELDEFNGLAGDRSSKEKLHPNTLATKEVLSRPRKTYMQQLALFDGRKSDVPFWKLLLRPFPLFLQPAVIWACLLQGCIIGWTVMVGVIISLVFIGPPLFRSEAFTGYQYTAAVIGALLGLFGSGAFSEMLTNYLTRRAGGLYEPEYRIILVIPTLIASAIGLYGFGFAASDVTYYGYITVDVFLGFIIGGMVGGTISSAQYILDDHRDISIEAFTNMIIFKNLFSFVLAYYSFDWVQGSGIKDMFLAFGSIQTFICLLSIPMYVFGKRNRAFFYRHDLLKMTGLR